MRFRMLVALLVVSLTPSLLWAQPNDAKVVHADVAILRQDWTCVGVQKDGVAAEPVTVIRTFLAVGAENLRLDVSKYGGLRGRYQLHPERQPKEFDVVIEEFWPPGKSADFSGAFRGQVAVGIYEVADDTIRLCWAAPGRPRPGAFKAERGDGLTLVVFRQKTDADRFKEARGSYKRESIWVKFVAPPFFFSIIGGVVGYWIGSWCAPYGGSFKKKRERSQSGMWVTEKTTYTIFSEWQFSEHNKVVAWWVLAGILAGFAAGVLYALGSAIWFW